MFTRSELDATIEAIKSKNLYRSLTVQFTTYAGFEAGLTFFCGPKKQYENGILFWLFCLTWLDDNQQGFRLLMNHRYPDRKWVFFDVTKNTLIEVYTLCQIIEPERFSAMINDYSSRLKNEGIPHSYQWEGHIQRAMQMYDDWNDQFLLAETESEFLAFHWVTGA